MIGNQQTIYPDAEIIHLWDGAGADRHANQSWRLTRKMIFLSQTPVEQVVEFDDTEAYRAFRQSLDINGWILTDAFEDTLVRYTRWELISEDKG
ncbi:MAG: hypothetical protein AAFV33_24895 [Chloroflexota bacterium]